MKFIKVGELKNLLEKAPEDAYVILYDSEDEGDTFLEKFEIRNAEEGSGYCQGDSVLDEAVSDGHLKESDKVVVLSGGKYLLR